MVERHACQGLAPSPPGPPARAAAGDGRLHAHGAVKGRAADSKGGDGQLGGSPEGGGARAHYAATGRLRDWDRGRDRTAVSVAASAAAGHPPVAGRGPTVGSGGGGRRGDGTPLWVGAPNGVCRTGASVGHAAVLTVDGRETAWRWHCRRSWPLCGGLG